MKIILLAIFLFFANFVAADMLYLNDGEEMSGILKEIDSQYVYFENFRGEIRKIPRKEVAHILVSTIRKNDHITIVENITDPKLKKILDELPCSSEFPDANHVTLLRSRIFNYISESEIHVKSRNIVWILREPALSQADQEVFYYTDRQEVELLYAHTISPTGNIYHITDDAISDESIFSATPEYSKLKKLKIAMKNVNIGSILDYSFEETLTDINHLQPFRVSRFFKEREPVLKDEIIVNFPSNMKLNKSLLQWPKEGAPDFESLKENDRITWKWTHSDREGLIAEQNMLPYSSIFPRVLVFQPWDWQETAKKINQAYKDAAPSDELLESLFERAQINEEMNDFAIADALYQTINRQIRSIGLSPNQMGSFAPICGETTLNRRYGNRQAKLALLHFALKANNIHSKVGFASSKRSVVDPAKHPSLAFTNNPVLKIQIDDSYIYTDGGSQHTPLGALSTALQGGYAVFFHGADVQFEKLPVYTYEWNRYDRTVKVILSKDGSMKVNEVILYRGPYESGIRSLASLRRQEQRNYAERRIKSIHPNASLISFGFSDLERHNSPVVLTLNYKIPDAAGKASDYIMTFTNFWLNYTSGSASLLNREFPMQYWATEENQQTIIFKLPEGFNWVPWNRQYEYRSGRINFMSGMHQNENLLVYSDRYNILTDEFLTDAEYQDYRNCILTMSELANQWIIIERERETESPPSSVATETIEIIEEQVD